MRAFGKAMLDQVSNPKRNVTFRYSVVGGEGMTCRCHDFVEPREEEKRLINECLEGKSSPRILDFGCGVGRHSSYVKTQCPDAQITIVEHDPDLRKYTHNRLQASAQYEHLEDIPDSECFDLIILLGNGLGIFGDEQQTREGLQKLRGMLSETGKLLVESGTFMPASFTTITHKIEYENLTDGPFQWSYANEEWVREAVQSAGFRIKSTTASSMRGNFFIMIIEH